MFGEIPERLANEIRGISDKSFDSPHARYVYAASLFIAAYLRIIPTGSDADRFFERVSAPDGSVTYELSTRILMVGETLFFLRSEPGFSEFCRRFQGRDFRSTFFELYAARLFQRGNFVLHAVPETGVKRADFDFRAVRRLKITVAKPYILTKHINVEVTALTAPRVSIRTIQNALDTKRKQLPTDAPAVIFCVHPESWLNAANDLPGSVLIEAAKRFFSRSKRVNAIVFATERHLPLSDRSHGAIVLMTNRIVNERARHAMNSLDFMDSNQSLAQVKNMVEDRALVRNEFYEWVDTLIREAKS